MILCCWSFSSSWFTFSVAEVGEEKIIVFIVPECGNSPALGSLGLVCGGDPGVGGRWQGPWEELQGWAPCCTLPAWGTARASPSLLPCHCLSPEWACGSPRMPRKPAASGGPWEEERLRLGRLGTSQVSLATHRPGPFWAQAGGRDTLHRRGTASCSLRHRACPPEQAVRGHPTALHGAPGHSRSSSPLWPPGPAKLSRQPCPACTIWVCVADAVLGRWVV